MFSRPRSFSVLYGIQRNLLALFYLISVVSVFWLIFWLLYHVLHTGGAVIIPVSIAYLVLIVLGYSLIRVISYIPANLAGAFDPLKNKIADRSVATAADLAGELAEFLCSFFNFAFFDIEFSAVRILGCDPVCSEGFDLGKAGLDPGTLEEFAGERKETSFYGRIKSGYGSLYMYVIPLVFGGKPLGYMAIATRRKLWRTFVFLLDEFENDFVDDQVVHVLARETDAIS